MRALLLAVLLAAVSAAAQEFPVKGLATNDPNAGSSRLQAFQGCLFRSSAGLTFKSIENHEFRLVRSKSLDSYVGQEVKIRAHNENPGDPSSDEGIGQAGPQHAPMTLVVEDIQKVSDHCTLKR